MSTCGLNCESARPEGYHFLLKSYDPIVTSGDRWEWSRDYFRLARCAQNVPAFLESNAPARSMPTMLIGGRRVFTASRPHEQSNRAALAQKLSFVQASAFAMSAADQFRRCRSEPNSNGAKLIASDGHSTPDGTVVTTCARPHSI